MLEITKVFNCEDKSQRRLWKFFLFISFLVAFFISETDPVIANDILMLLELIFIVSYWLKSSLKEDWREIYLQNQMIFVLFGLWALSAFFSLIDSPYIFLSSGNNILFDHQPLFTQIPRYFASLVTLAFAFCLFHFVYTTRTNLLAPYLIFVLSALLIALNFVAVWNLYPELRGAREWFVNPPFYLNIMHGGFHANAAVCVMVGMVYASLNRVDQSRNLLFVSFVGLVLMWTYLFWTGGRASSLATVLSVGLVLFFLDRLNQKVLKLSLIVFVSMVIAAFLSEWLAVVDRSGFFSMFEKNRPADISQLSPGRMNMWSQSWEALDDNLLFGLGPEGYLFSREELFGKSLSIQPHNVLVQFLIEWGLVGSILFISLLVTLFKKGVRIFIDNLGAESTFLRLIALMIIISYSLTGLVDGTFYYAQPVFLLVLSFVVLLLPERSPETGEKQ